MQITALIVEFLIPGVLLLVGLLGIVDVLLASQLTAIVFPASGLDVGNQVGIGIVLLALAYVLGVFTNLALYGLPIFRDWYTNMALTIYSKYEDALREKAVRVFGHEIPTCEGGPLDRAKAVNRLFDEVWGYLRARAGWALDEYKVCVSWERLCRGCILAFPFLAVMVALQWNKLGRTGKLAAPAGEMWALMFSGLLILLLVLFGLAIYLLRYSVRLEYELLAVVFLGVPSEQPAAPPQRVEREGILELLTRWLRREGV